MSSVQSKAFIQAAKTHQRGGAAARICGATTRNGGACSNPPIKGDTGRCLSHCGPKAAKAFRERQQRRFEAGKISAEEWNRAEARRVVNRLGDAWKKDPWLPGSTIDLGDHEEALAAALGGLDLDVMPPSVVDWLRWKYQRLQVDTRNDAAWMEVRMSKLPKRLEKAGERPDRTVVGDVERAAERAVWRLSDGTDLGRWTRRRLPDAPRAEKAAHRGASKAVGRPRTRPVDMQEEQQLLSLYREHSALLAPIMAVTVGEAKQWAVLRTLQVYLASPKDTRAHQRWLALVKASLVPPVVSRGRL